MTDSALTYAKLQQPYSSGPTTEFVDVMWPARTTAQLADAADDINLVDKFQGKCVYDTTQGEPVFAFGAAASDPWYTAVELSNPFSATTAALEAVGNDINTVHKHAGKIIYNSTSGILVYADGAAAADDWLGVHDNLVDHSPV